MARSSLQSGCLLLFFYGIIAVTALPGTSHPSEGLHSSSAFVDDPPHINPVLIPKDYPEYRATVELTIANASDSSWNGAAIVACPGEDGPTFLWLCADKTATPKRLVFQDIMGIAGQDLATKGRWMEHPEAFLPMPPGSQLPQSSNSSILQASDFTLPTNRLFEGILLDAKDLSRRFTAKDGTLSLVGATTNSTMYSAQTRTNSIDWTWSICTADNDEPRNGLTAASVVALYTADRWGDGHCQSVSAVVKMNVIQVLPPLAQRVKTESESPFTPRWRDPPVPESQLPPQNKYVETFNLIVNSLAHPEFDGMGIEPCNPKPFIELPHINTDPRDPQPTRFDLLWLPSAILQYRNMLILCANRTGVPAELGFSATTGNEWVPRSWDPLYVGSLFSTATSANWLGDNDFVGFGGNNDTAMYTFQRDGEDDRFGLREFNLWLCDQPSRGKTITVLYDKDQTKLDAQKTRDSYKVRNCTAVGIRKQAAKARGAVDSPFGPGVLPATPTADSMNINDSIISLLTLYGGPDFEYSDWLKNLTIITARGKAEALKGTATALAKPKGTGFGPNGDIGYEEFWSGMQEVENVLAGGIV